MWDILLYNSVYVSNGNQTPFRRVNISYSKIRIIPFISFIGIPLSSSIFFCNCLSSSCGMHTVVVVSSSLTTFSLSQS